MTNFSKAPLFTEQLPSPGDGGPSPELHSTKSDAKRTFAGKRKQNERQTDSFEKQDTAQGPNRPTSDGDNMHTEKTGMEGWSKEVSQCRGVTRSALKTLT